MGPYIQVWLIKICEVGLELASFILLLFCCNKSPDKNCNDIRNSLCMPTTNYKANNLYKEPQYSLKTSSSGVSNTGVPVFDDITRFPWQQISDII